MVKAHTKQNCSRNVFSNFIHHSIDHFRAVKNMFALILFDLSFGLKKLGKCEKHMTWHLFSNFLSLKTCYEMEYSNLIFLIQHWKLNKKPILSRFYIKESVNKSNYKTTWLKNSSYLRVRAKAKVTVKVRTKGKCESEDAWKPWYS